MADLPITTEQTLAVLNEIVKTTGVDSFRLQLERKTPGQIYPTLVGTFDGVTFEMLNTPETWLPSMLGGGLYTAKIKHANDLARLGGTILWQIEGLARPLDFDMIESLDWTGPKNILYPKRETPQRLAPPPAVRTFSGAGGGVVPRNAPPEQPPAPGVASQDPSVRDALERLREQEARMREDIRRQEQTLAEERRRMEREADRRESEANLAKLRAEITAAQKPSGPSEITSLIVEMQKMQQAQAAEARASNERMLTILMETQKTSREESARTATALAEVQAKSQETVVGLMKTSLEDAKRANENTAGTFAKMGEAAASVMNLALNAVHSMQELQGGPTEPPMLTVVKEVGKAVMSYAEMTKASRMTVQQPPPRQRNGAARRARVAPAPAAPPPVQAVPQEGQPAAPAAAAPTLDGVEADADSDAEGDVTAFESIVDGIREHAVPEEIVKFFLDNLDEESIVEAMTAAGGNPLVAFSTALGTWTTAEENKEYIKELIFTLEEQGKARGLVRDSTPGESALAKERVAAAVAPPAKA